MASKLKKKNKKPKSTLTPAEKEMGKRSIYILIGMIIVGAIVGLYYIQ